MSPVDDLVNQLVDQLNQKGLLFNQSKEGLWITKVEGGVLIHNLNKNGEKLRLNETQIKYLRSTFPSLDSLLVRNADTLRRAKFLKERMANPNFQYWVSLDESIPQMPTAQQVQANDTKTLPRRYATVDMSNPDKPVVMIFGSEIPIEGPKNLRPDEAMFAFEVDPKSSSFTKLITGELTIDEALIGIEAKNPRIVYYDDNEVITGKRRLEHHLKSVETMEAWGVDVIERYELNVTGEVYLHVEDDFSLPPGVLVSEQGASPERFKESMGGPGVPEERMILTRRSTVVSTEGGTKFAPKPVAWRNSFIKSMSTIERNEIRRRMNQVLVRIGQAIATAKK